MPTVRRRALRQPDDLYLHCRQEPERRAALRAVLARGLVALSERLGVSGAHVTFTTADDSAALERHGFLPRLGMQYHWSNQGYASFDEYLATLKQSRRKAIRQARAARARAVGVRTVTAFSRASRWRGTRPCRVSSFGVRAARERERWRGQRES